MKIRWLLTAMLALPFSFAHADELTFYAYPSPLGISWDSPEQTGWTGLMSETAFDPRFKDVHSLGHVQIELNCEESTSGPAQYVFTGMTNISDSEFASDLLDHGYGLGLLVGSFKGREENTVDIEADLPARYKSGRISFIDFMISPATCQRAAQYLAEYHALGYDKIYGGLADRPRYGEGAGCSAFGQSVLEIAGLMAPSWYQDWTRSVRVPYTLVGGPLTNEDVPLAEVLFGSHAMRWADPGERSFDLFFWDPDRIYNWINQNSAIKRGKAKGLFLDRRETPTPTDPFWKQGS
jgi:hypothetical protein